jgi:heme/copper-type cytochrome/quinol oxidase subunit 2|tara:strand:- start:552 stop:782 length:231 start_codon:yes stop_codon:yes gene_type:complete
MLKRTSIVFVLILLSVTDSFSQCAMCRAQLESMEDTSMAESVNDGIVYLMAVPYVLIAVIAFFIYRSFNKKSNKNT